uniref:Uncharacterized protein n=1 Tax=Acrobeloides nanus TaxID=290746 RepID=A0A914CBZ6_9BILA
MHERYAHKRNLATQLLENNKNQQTEKEYLIKDMSSTKTNSDKSRTENAKLQNELADLTAKIKKLTEEKEKIIAENEEMRIDWTMAKGENEKLKKENDELRNQNGTLREVAENFQKNIEGLLTDILPQMQLLRERYNCNQTSANDSCLNPSQREQELMEKLESTQKELHKSQEMSKQLENKIQELERANSPQLENFKDVFCKKIELAFASNKFLDEKSKMLENLNNLFKQIDKLTIPNEDGASPIDNNFSSAEFVTITSDGEDEKSGNKKDDAPFTSVELTDMSTSWRRISVSNFGSATENSEASTSSVTSNFNMAFPSFVNAQAPSTSTSLIQNPYGPPVQTLINILASSPNMTPSYDARPSTSKDPKTSNPVMNEKSTTQDRNLQKNPGNRSLKQTRTTTDMQILTTSVSNLSSTVDALQLSTSSSSAFSNSAHARINPSTSSNQSAAEIKSSSNSPQSKQTAKKAIGGNTTPSETPISAFGTKTSTPRAKVPTTPKRTRSIDAVDKEPTPASIRNRISISISGDTPSSSYSSQHKEPRRSLTGEDLSASLQKRPRINYDSYDNRNSTYREETSNSHRPAMQQKMNIYKTNPSKLLKYRVAGANHK